MDHTFDYKRTILEGFEVLGLFKLPETIRGTYEKHAIAKIDNAILKLRGHSIILMNSPLTRQDKNLIP